MRLSHAFLTVSVLLLGPSLGSSAAPALSADESADLSGAYICNGKNFDGSTYEGRVEIVRKNGAFQLLWLSDSDVVGLGMGIRTGNVLAVAFYSGVPGVVAYRIEGQNRLVGEWTVAGADGEVSSETLTKVPDEALDRSPSSAPKTPRPSREHEQLPRTVKPAREVREL